MLSYFRKLTFFSLGQIGLNNPPHPCHKAAQALIPGTHEWVFLHPQDVPEVMDFLIR